MSPIFDLLLQVLNRIAKAALRCCSWFVGAGYEVLDVLSWGFASEELLDNVLAAFVVVVMVSTVAILIANGLLNIAMALLW